jgi:hypothetical protein
MHLEKCPLSKLVLGLCSQTQTDYTEPPAPQQVLCVFIYSEGDEVLELL